MTIKHEIEIEGLPEGWKAVAFRKPLVGEQCWHKGGVVYEATKSVVPCFIVQKIKPRRIVLEETEESNTITSGIWDLQRVADLKIWHEPKIWREVEDKDD